LNLHQVTKTESCVGNDDIK